MASGPGAWCGAACFALHGSMHKQLQPPPHAWPAVAGVGYQLFSPVRGQLAHTLVVAGQAVDTGLHQNQAAKINGMYRQRVNNQIVCVHACIKFKYYHAFTMQPLKLAYRNLPSLSLRLRSRCLRMDTACE